MKNIVDRILPLATMYTCFVKGQMRHVPRYRKDFTKAEADDFAGPELLPSSAVRKFNLIGKPMQKLMMSRIAKSLGCKEKLDARPYHIERK